MEIKTEDYQICYDPETKTVIWQGLLQLSDMDEYAPIVDLLDGAAHSEPLTLRLDLRGLEFLNSSGINMLSRFVIKVRQRQDACVIVQGSKKITWQGKSLKNLQRLMPSLQLELE